MSLKETNMAAMRLAFFFFTLSTLLGAYHARHLHDGFKTTEVIQMVTGEEEPQSPPPPPSQSSSQEQEQTTYGQVTYGGDNPKSNSPTIYGGVGVARKWLAALLIPSYDDEVVYGRDYLNAQPSPQGASPDNDEVYGRDKPKAPPSPPSLTPDSLMDRITYSRDDPRSPPIPDPIDTHNQGMYGRVDPRVPIPPQPADPTRPLLFESICGNGGSLCAD